MALNIRGVQPLAWGTQAITGYVTESSSLEPSTEEFILKDEEGHIITQITGFGEKTECTFSVIPKSGIVTPPVPGDVMTVGTFGFVILRQPKKRTQGDVEKWDFVGVNYPGIDLGEP
jgi:hypothetical protein